MPTATKTKPRLTREQKFERVRDLSAKLREFSESLDPVERAAYELRFSMYSARNALAIVMQRPDATVVRGFQAWKALGRQVRKGEKGIMILAPAGTGEKDAVEVQPDGAGTPNKPTRMFFRGAFVFDIAQTEELTKPDPNAAVETFADCECDELCG